jgi:hypothetical protein
MAIQIVFEAHCTTEDNEKGVATGWLPGRLSAFAPDAPRSTKPTRGITIGSIRWRLERER